MTVASDDKTKDTHDVASPGAFDYEAFGKKPRAEQEDELFKIFKENPSVFEEVTAELEKRSTQQLPPAAPASPAPAPTPAPQPQAASSATPQGGGEVVVDEEVTIKVRPSDLKTYLKNRTVEEAVREALKGKDEADKTIDFFKVHKVPSLERQLNAERATTTSLRKEIEEWRRKAERAPSAPAQPPQPQAESEIALPEIPEISDDIDMFDPDDQKKVLGAVKTIPKLLEAIKDLKSRKPEPPAAPPEPEHREPEGSRQQANTGSVTDEYAEIRMLQANPEFADVFGTSTDIADLDSQYFNFVKNMATAAGISSFVDESGRWTDQVRRAIALYNDQNSSEGKTLRELCERNAIKPPEEMEALTRIYRVRSLRSDYARRGETGEAKPIEYEDAARFFVANNPSVRRQKTAQDQVAEQERIARAIANRNQYSREPPASSGADQSRIEDLPMERFNALVKKDRKSYTAEETELVKRVLKEGAQMSESEIESWFRSP